VKASNILLSISLLAVLMIFSGSVLAGEDNSKVGTRVFNFLKIPVGARAVAMGGAFTGVADDESSLYYNPAGVATLEGRRFIAGYHNNIFDMQSGFLGYIHPLGSDRKVSLYVNYLNYGDFVRTNRNGEELGTFSGSDVLFAGGYAMNLNEAFSIGGTVKFVYEKIDSYSSSGFAVDLGARYSRVNGRTTFGFMIQNLGKQSSSFVEDGETDPLPLYFRGGASTYLKGLPMLWRWM